MTEKKLTLKEFDDYIELVASYYDENQNIEDFVHDSADGSEFAIYTGKAWDLVNLMRDNMFTGLYDRAEYMAQECSSEKQYELDKIMSQMAYWIVYYAIQEELKVE